MAGWISAVQITCAGGSEEIYEREAGALAKLYGALLGMRRIDIGYMKLTKGDGVVPEIGFEGDNGQGDARPRWPDPDHPQQMHVDIDVADLDAAEKAVLELGATRLARGEGHRVYADTAGHPFCLYPNTSLAGGPLPGRLTRVVIDCFSPRALAGFYETLLGMRRVVDTPERVELAGTSRTLRARDDADRPVEVTISADEPLLAFQHVARYRPPRWPDPAYPEQLHLDLWFDDPEAAPARIQQLGAILLRTGSLHSVYADPAGHPFCGPPTRT